MNAWRFQAFHILFNHKSNTSISPLIQSLEFSVWFFLQMQCNRLILSFATRSTPNLQRWLVRVSIWWKRQNKLPSPAGVHFPLTLHFYESASDGKVEKALAIISRQNINDIWYPRLVDGKKLGPYSPTSVVFVRTFCHDREGLCQEQNQRASRGWSSLSATAVYF